MLFDSVVVSALALLALKGRAVDAKAVFCHYLVGTLSDGSGHAEADIDGAQKMGFDAFALDILDPTASFTSDALKQLFDHAQSVGFKLFFSLDAGAHSNIEDFKPLLHQYLGNPAYYTKTPNNNPMLSTFDSGAAGGNTVQTWTNFLGEFANKLYFVPDFDDVSEYYSNPSGFFDSWEGILQGAFSWESAWPKQQDTPANESISTDQTVMSAAHSKSKEYMIGLSTVQSKHIDKNQNWYRTGEVNMPERMTDILHLGQSSPDYVEVITWNDGGEGHYIGNVWTESIGGGYKFDGADHSGWQPLFSSFIAAYKAGQDAGSMQPPSGSSAVGAMWYHPLLKSAKCAGDPLGPPAGIGAAQDAVNFAVVLPSGASGMAVKVTSGGSVLQTVPVSSGLNYASVPGLKTGAQKIELVDGSGKTVLTAAGSTDVAADASTCDFNYQVAGLKQA